MKQVIIGVCCILIMFYAVYANENFIDEALRSSELSMATVHGFNQTLEAQKGDPFGSGEEMKQYFMKLLKAQITSDVVVQVNIISSSCMYEMIDVKIREFFWTSDQKKGDCSA